MKILSAISTLLLIGLAFPVFAEGKADDIAAVKTTLQQLFEFSNKQALQTPEARQLLTGEALEWKMPGFGEAIAAPDKVVLVDAQNAVGRIQLHGKNRVVDLYFYLKLQDSWKISAVRTLALTGIVEGACEYLKTKPNLTAAEKDELGNCELVLASDEALHQWFAKNAVIMNKLYDITRGQKPGYSSEQNNPKYADLKTQLKSLHFSGLAEVQTDGNVEFVIGGMTDNTVGFLYSPNNQPPKISSNLYIWVEEIAPKWFLFRTT
jgi:hypothetical protein